MRSSRQRTRPLKERRVSRRWCIPTAITRDSSETLDGVNILYEFKNDLGTLLWRTVRDVGLWADTPPASRGDLFSSEKAARTTAWLGETPVPAEVAKLLDTIAAMLDQPTVADPEVLRVCCMRLAAWAVEQQAPHTALAYAQAAALSAPDDPASAFQTGLYANAAGQPMRAVTWFRRALALSRRTRHWETYARASLSIGEHYEQQAPRRAEQYFRLAGRTARRNGLRMVRMQAAYGRFRLAVVASDDELAADHARATVSAYTETCPGAPQMLLHVARFWIDRFDLRQAAPALRRIMQARKHLTPAEHLLAAGMAARVHTAGGRVNPAQKAAAEAWRWMQHASVGLETQLTAALDLVHAAALINDEAGFKQAQDTALRIVPVERFSALREELISLAPRGRAASQAKLSSPAPSTPANADRR